MFLANKEKSRHCNAVQPAVSFQLTVFSHTFTYYYSWCTILLIQTILIVIIPPLSCHLLEKLPNKFIIHCKLQYVFRNIYNKMLVCVYVCMYMYIYIHINYEWDRCFMWCCAWQCVCFVQMISADSIYPCWALPWFSSVRPSKYEWFITDPLIGTYLFNISEGIIDCQESTSIHKSLWEN